MAWLRPQKNPALLLEAFRRGPAPDPRAHLLFVGIADLQSGDLQSELERQIGASGLRERVHLLGLRSDVPEILNAADVFVLGSDYEGNPLAVLEAMAAGKPIVSTAVGGVPELVEGGCGLLVPPRDAQALSKAMGYMLESPEARKSMGEASARRAVERFELRVMTGAYEDLTRSASQTFGLDGKTLIPVAGRLMRRAVRLITSIGGVGIYYRELASLRYERDYLFPAPRAWRSPSGRRMRSSSPWTRLRERTARRISPTSRCHSGNRPGSLRGEQGVPAHRGQQEHGSGGERGLRLDVDLRQHRGGWRERDRLSGRLQPEVLEGGERSLQFLVPR